MRVRRRRQSLSQPEKQPEDRFDSSSIINHKALETLPMALTPAGNQVNLPFSYYHYHRSKGTTSLPRRRGGTTDARDTFRSLAKPNGKAQVVPPFHLLHLHHVATERNDKPTVCSYRRQWKPLSHGHWSCSSKPLTGRTGLQTEGRFSLLETLHEPQPDIQEYSTGQGLVS